ncbi:TM2 domain-containing protein [Robertkochia aurantiaca]|uniref:TM2 domain-containing protein n=1 Tax=Robertkochia aurantiaca TaxID=2873700 RepID=UPI001CCB0FA4|nr:NINE protein [Robertkochia sp. 3YJGBD-33]
MDEKKKPFGDKAKDFANEAEEEFKRTAKEFSDGAKEALGREDNKKLLAGILAILLGGFGVHKFILGYNKEGFIMLGVTLILGAITCGAAGWLVWVVGLIEGVIYLTKSDLEFYQTYQAGNKPWF